jgi:hypothetical protein
MKGVKPEFTRWYDSTPELAQAVRLLEHGQPEVQHVIARLIVDTFSLNDLSERQDLGLKRVGTEKVLGLMKSKGKRRWYDRDPMVHQAFNYLYLAEGWMRQEMALKIIVSVRVLEEVHTRQQLKKAKESAKKQSAEAESPKPPPFTPKDAAAKKDTRADEKKVDDKIDVAQALKLVRGIFRQPITALMEKTNFVVQSSTSESDSPEASPSLTLPSLLAVESSTAADLPASPSESLNPSEIDAPEQADEVSEKPETTEETEATKEEEEQTDEREAKIKRAIQTNQQGMKASEKIRF